MADVKISELPTGSALDGSELVPVVQAGDTIQTTTGDIVSLSVEEFPPIQCEASPSQKISEMSAAATLDGTELVPLVQGGSNVQATAQDIADLGGGGGSGFNLNTAEGISAGDGAWAGSAGFQCAYGPQALASFTGTGVGHDSNTAIGYQALNSLVDGAFNTAVGDLAGRGAIHSSNGVYIGEGSFNTDDSDGNTVIGQSADAGGGTSVAVGYLASTVGAGSITIGANSQANGNNSVVIGVGKSDGGISNCVIIGRNATSSPDPNGVDINAVFVCDGTNTFVKGPGGGALPIADPGVSGALYVLAGVLMVSP